MDKSKPDMLRATEIVQAGGGRIVGRTRLQKIAFLLEIAGLGEGFQFEYKHYGPYSDELTDAIREATAFGLVREEETETNWGGWYSTFISTSTAPQTESVKERVELVAAAQRIASVELELAATAVYLCCVEGSKNPWEETKKLKGNKAAQGRLERAQAHYRSLIRVKTPKPLPSI